MYIIPINDDLKNIPFLYIENDKSLSDIDKQALEFLLGGAAKWANLNDYNIEYHFEAYSSKDTFEKIKKANYILLNTKFTGISGQMLHNFILGAIQNKLKDKVIINCTPFSKVETIFKDLKNKIIELEEENNIQFYFQGWGTTALVKYNNDKGFLLC